MTLFGGPGGRDTNKQLEKVAKEVGRRIAEPINAAIAEGQRNAVEKARKDERQKVWEEAARMAEEEAEMLSKYFGEDECRGRMASLNAMARQYRHKAEE